MFQNQEKLLRYSLIANGIFSGISGIILILISHDIAEWFEVEFYYPQTGAALLLFSGAVLYSGFRSQIDYVQVWTIIWMDLLWVAASIILLLSPVSISAAGIWSVIIVAIFVSDFALFQYKGLKKATSSSPGP